MYPETQSLSLSYMWRYLCTDKSVKYINGSSVCFLIESWTDYWNCDTDEGFIPWS